MNSHTQLTSTLSRPNTGREAGTRRRFIADVVAVAIGSLFSVKLESTRKVKEHLLRHTKNPAAEVVKLLSTIEKVLRR